MNKFLYGRLISHGEIAGDLLNLLIEIAKTKDVNRYLFQMKKVVVNERPSCSKSLSAVYDYIDEVLVRSKPFKYHEFDALLDAVFMEPESSLTGILETTRSPYMAKVSFGIIERVENGEITQIKAKISKSKEGMSLRKYYPTVEDSLIVCDIDSSPCNYRFNICSII